MTKKQKREHKLGNAVRAARRSGVLKKNETGDFQLLGNQTGRGLLPRINRWVERASNV